MKPMAFFCLLVLTALPSFARDLTLTCNDCGAQFTFTESEQAFYKSKGFTNQPTRCPDCRKARRAQRSNASFDRPDTTGMWGNDMSHTPQAITEENTPFRKGIMLQLFMGTGKEVTFARIRVTNVKDFTFEAVPDRWGAFDTFSGDISTGELRMTSGKSPAQWVGKLVDRRIVGLIDGKTRFVIGYSDEEAKELSAPTPDKKPEPAPEPVVLKPTPRYLFTVALVKFKCDVKDAGGDAEFAGKVTVTRIITTAGLDANSFKPGVDLVLWEHGLLAGGKDNLYKVDKKSENNLNSAITGEIDFIPGTTDHGSLILKGTNLFENDNIGSDKFTDFSQTLSVDELIKTPEKYITLRSNYAKSSKEYMEFTFKITSQLKK